MDTDVQISIVSILETFRSAKVSKSLNFKIWSLKGGKCSVLSGWIVYWVHSTDCVRPKKRMVLGSNPHRIAYCNTAVKWFSNHLNCSEIILFDARLEADHHGDFSMANSMSLRSILDALRYFLCSLALFGTFRCFSILFCTLKYSSELFDTPQCSSVLLLSQAKNPGRQRENEKSK